MLFRSLSSLRRWLEDKSELESFLQEDLAWRFIRMSCDTDSEAFRNSFNHFLSEIEAKASTQYDLLNKKLLSAPALSLLDGSGVDIMLRSIRKQVEIFRAENVPLFNELQQKEQEYSAITGAMTIHADGKELTLQQASNYLKHSYRNLDRKSTRLNSSHT